MSRDSSKAIQPCGAKTRQGTPCKTPVVSGKKRCRMHGGAPGSGAPKGNTNALKFGFYTKEAKEERKRFRQLWKKMEKELDEVRELTDKG